MTELDLPAVVRTLGLWWPDADPAELHRAADHCDSLALAIDPISKRCTGAATRLAGANAGPAADSFAGFWAKYDDGKGGGYLPETARAAREQATKLREYAEQVTHAQRQVIEIASTIAVTAAAGLALSFVTFGVSEAGALTAGAALVAAAAEVGVTLSATVAAIVVGATEAVLLDVAIAQPMRVWGFYDGGFSLSEAELSALGGGIGGAAGAKLQAWLAGRAASVAPLDPAGSGLARRLPGGEAGSFGLVDPVDPETNAGLFRTPAGALQPASNGPLRIHLDTVRAVAAHYGIDLDGVPVAIEFDLPCHGATDYDQAIAFGPSAFRSEEDLARTIFHERFHVEQIRNGLESPEVTGIWDLRIEHEAYAAEDAWWAVQAGRRADG